MTDIADMTEDDAVAIGIVADRLREHLVPFLRANGIVAVGIDFMVIVGAHGCVGSIGLSAGDGMLAKLQEVKARGIAVPAAAQVN